MVPQTATDAKPGFFTRMKTSVSQGAKAVATKMKQCFAVLKDRARTAKTRAKAALATVGNILPVKRFLAVAAAVGMTVAIVSYVVPQEISAMLSGLGGAVVALAVQAFRWLRRSARSLVWMG